MKTFGVVYLLWNMVNGKKYVGQTIQPLKKRISQHGCGDLCVDRAIRKYGKKNFRYGVIKSCASKAEMDYWEKYFIVALKSKKPYGYNISDGGDGTVGAKRSPETRAKMAAAKMGDKNPNYGKPLSDEQKAKLSIALTGKKKNLDFNGEKNPFFGKKHTQKTRILISAFRRGNTPYKNLVAEMNARQLTDNDIAQFLNVTRRAVSRKIRGERNFTDNDKVKLEEIFGLPAEYLFQRDEE